MAVAQIEITESIARKVLSIVDAGLVKGVGEPKPGEMCVEAAVNYALDLPHGDDPQCVSRALRSLKIALNDKAWSSNQSRAKGLRRLALAQLGSRDHLDDVEFAKRVAALAIRMCVPQALRAAASIRKDPARQAALRAAADKCEREPTKANAIEARETDAACATATATACAYADAAAYADAVEAAACATAYATSCATAHAADAADAAVSAAATSAAHAAEAAAAAAAACTAAAAVATSTAYAADAAAGAAAASAADAADAADAAAGACAAAASAADAADAASAFDKSLADFAEGVLQILIEMNAPGCQWLALAEQESV